MQSEMDLIGAAVKRRLFILLLCLILISLFSCAKEDILFLIDPYREKTTFSGEKPLSRLHQLADENRRELRAATFTKEESASLAQQIEKTVDESAASAVLMTPIAAAAARSLPAKYPQKQFYCIEQCGNMVDSGNIRRINIDRIGMYEEAGSLFRQYLEENSASAGTVEAGTRVAALFYTGTRERRAEKEAFLDGFSPSEIEDKLLLEEIEDLSRQSRALEFVRELDTRNVSLCLLSASNLNELCIQQLLNTDILIATEDAAASEAFRDRVYFSIETDYTRVLEAVIRDMQAPGEGPLTVEAVIVRGSAYEYRDEPENPLER